MKTKLLFLFCIVALNSFAQAPDWLWAKSADGSKDDVSNSVTTDISGNVYIVGMFDSDSITFAATTLINVNTDSTDDVFLVKYDANGNVLWAKSAGGNKDDRAYSVTTDPFGNIYVAGYFWSSYITFGSDTLENVDTTSGNTFDMFLVKYDPIGTVLWAKHAGGNKDDYMNFVTADKSGNIYVAGYFLSDSIAFDSVTLINVGTPNLFLIKYDANGNVVWAKSKRSSGIRSVTTDISGNVYVVGFFYSPTITFDSITLNLAGSSDMFLVKYDTNGNLLWAKGAGGSNFDWVYSVAVDAAENVYVTGWGGTMYFGSIPLYCAGGYDMFLAKYDVNGNVLWATRAGGSINDGANSITVDAAGNIYVVGSFESTSITFGSTTLNRVGINDIFFVKYNTQGHVLWAKRIGGSNDEYVKCVIADTSGNIYVTGYFRSPSIFFDPDTLTGSGDRNIFLSKLSAPCLMLTSSTTTITCSGNNNGSATANILSGTTSYTYQWNNGQTTSAAIGLVAGDYTVTVANANGCSVIDIVTITQPLPLAININTTNASSCSASDGKLSAFSWGGTPPYSYLWTNGKTIAAITGLALGNYTLTVTDANNCTYSKDGTISCLNGVVQLPMQTAFAVYPNPSNGTFIIETKENEYVLIITNVFWEKVYQSTIRQLTDAPIDISKLPNGIYFLNIKTENEAFLQKVVIQK